MLARAWRRRRAACVRAGMTQGEWVLALAVLAVLGGLGVAVGPRMLSAGTGPGELSVRAPRDASEREVFEALRGLLTRSRGLLAVRGGRGGGQTDLVLWYSDRVDRGSLNVSELLVLSHSSLLGTVTAYVRERPDALEAELLGAAPSDPVLPMESLVEPGFAERWRRSEDVEGRIVAAGVAVMRVERTEEGGGIERLRIGLTWGGGAVDESGVEAWFEVRLPALQGVGGGASGGLGR